VWKRLYRNIKTGEYIFTEPTSDSWVVKGHFDFFENKVNEDTHRYFLHRYNRKPTEEELNKFMDQWKDTVRKNIKEGEERIKKD